MSKRIFVLFIAMLFIAVSSVDAQYGSSRKKKKKKSSKPKTERTDRNATTNTRVRSDEVKFTDNLWYGANLGNISFGGGFFSFGLQPTVGYRLIDQLSIGFMFKMDYYFERGFGIGFEPYRYSTFDIGPTAFLRYKIPEQFFVQFEYERANFERARGSGGFPLIINGEVQKTRFSENYAYVGVGYGGGYPFATYISLHYNVLDEITATRIPWDYRIGFTWNF